MTALPPVLLDRGPLIAFDKPSGLQSIAGRGDVGPSLHELAAASLGVRLFVVHRLDRGTSGVILFARDAAAHRRLCSLFETRQVGKTYLAWVSGQPAGDAGRIDAPLREFGSGRVAVDARGKPAVTSWTVARREGGRALLQVRPETGRRHQIRAHLFSIGHPVLGDERYGAPRPVSGAPRLMLHAAELVVPWEDAAPLRISAPTPESFR